MSIFHLKYVWFIFSNLHSTSTNLISNPTQLLYFLRKEAERQKILPPRRRNLTIWKLRKASEPFSRDGEAPGRTTSKNLEPQTWVCTFHVRVLVEQNRGISLSASAFLLGHSGSHPRLFGGHKVFPRLWVEHTFLLCFFWSLRLLLLPSCSRVAMTSAPFFQHAVATQQIRINLISNFLCPLCLHPHPLPQSECSLQSCTSASYESRFRASSICAIGSSLRSGSRWYFF